jgi:hypothetical protein
MSCGGCRAGTKTNCCGGHSPFPWHGRSGSAGQSSATPAAAVIRQPCPRGARLVRSTRRGVTTLNCIFRGPSATGRGDAKYAPPGFGGGGKGGGPDGG